MSDKTFDDLLTLVREDNRNTVSSLRKLANIIMDYRELFDDDTYNKKLTVHASDNVFITYKYGYNFSSVMQKRFFFQLKDTSPEEFVKLVLERCKKKVLNDEYFSNRAMMDFSDRFVNAFNKLVNTSEPTVFRYWIVLHRHWWEHNDTFGFDYKEADDLNIAYEALKVIDKYYKFFQGNVSVSGMDDETEFTFKTKIVDGQRLIVSGPTYYYDDEG